MENYEKAVSEYKKSLRIKRDSAETYYGMALCYNKMGSVKKEIQAYKRTLAIKPDMLAALVNLGNTYFGEKNYGAAIKQYTKAIQIK